MLGPGLVGHLLGFSSALATFFIQVHGGSSLEAPRFYKARG
jgi:hypothetical protein